MSDQDTGKRATGISRLRPPQLRLPIAYSISPAAVLSVAVLQYALRPGPSITPFVFFFPCVALVSWIAGLGPGLLAVACAALVGNFLFVEPHGMWSTSGPAVIDTVFFVAAGGSLALLCALFRGVFLDRERLYAGRRLAEESLRASEERLRSHLDNSPLAIVEFDSRFRVTRWSKQAERMFGWTADEILGRAIDEIRWVHEEDAESVRRESAGLLTGERPRQQHSNRNYRKDGSVIHCEWYNSAIYDERGHLVSVLSQVLDVTDRKRAEQAIKDSERDLSRAQAVAQTGSWRLDVWRNELLWSDETHRMFGIPKGTPLTYEMFLSVIHPEDRGQVDRSWQAALRGEPYDVEHRILVDGKVKWVRERAELEFDAKGGLLGGFGTVQDVTEAKRLQEALRSANERLVEVDRRKNEFLAMLSHELRNPLAPISNSLYILSCADPESEQSRRALTVIERQVGHLSRLTDELLDIARITHGKVRLQRERLDLNRIALRAVDDHCSVFENLGVQLDAVPAPAEVWVSGDRTRLAQVVSNLLHNAAKFTPRGGKTSVVVEADAARGQAILTVRDTGGGIVPELMPRLFEAFAQGATTLDRGKGGLGLGLALVRGLVELHGGTVTAASDGPGRGAAFTIRLPLDKAVAPAAPEAAGPGSDDATRRVLIIEDNADAAGSLRDVLELGEHVVEVASGGSEGIEKARAFRPDVVLCDIGLPGMDGYAVARAMRADPELEGVALVALTGYAQPEDVAMAREAGFDAHISKPPGIKALEELIRTIGRRGGVQDRS